jgi:hypothetical protein
MLYGQLSVAAPLPQPCSQPGPQAAAARRCGRGAGVRPTRQGRWPDPRSGRHRLPCRRIWVGRLTTRLVRWRPDNARLSCAAESEDSPLVRRTGDSSLAARPASAPTACYAFPVRVPRGPCEHHPGHHVLRPARPPAGRMRFEPKVRREASTVRSCRRNQDSVFHRGPVVPVADCGPRCRRRSADGAEPARCQGTEVPRSAQEPYPGHTETPDAP